MWLKIIFAMMILWMVPLGSFVLSISNPVGVAHRYIAYVIIYEGYLFLRDIFGRPKVDPSYWSCEEIEIIKKYHLNFKNPFTAKLHSIMLNGIRFTAFLWVPWLLSNHMWFLAAFLTVNFFATSSLAYRLDPFFFLLDAMSRGDTNILRMRELALLEHVFKKMHGEIEDEDKYEDGKEELNEGYKYEGGYGYYDYGYEDEYEDEEDYNYDDEYNDDEDVLDDLDNLDNEKTRQEL